MSRLTFQLTVALAATLLAVVPVACSGGTGSAFGASGSGGRQGEAGPGGGQDEAGPGGGQDEAGPGGGQDEAGPGGGQGGAANEAPICKTYLACMAEVNPAGMAAILAAYGKTGSCWAQGDAGFCEKACMAGIVALHQTVTGSGSAACNRCATSADCPSSIPVCDTTSQRCVECLADPDCGSASKPACDLATHTCVACAADWQCASPDKPRCDVASQTCVGCLVASDCPAQQICDASAKFCRGCQNDAECPAAKPHCNTSSGLCYQCTSGQQCPSGICSWAAGTCCDGNACAKNGVECGLTFDSSCILQPIQCGDCTGGKLCVDGKCKPSPVDNCNPRACASGRCGYVPAQNNYQCVSGAPYCNVNKKCGPGFFCASSKDSYGTHYSCKQYCVTQADCSNGTTCMRDSPTSYGMCL